MFIYFFYMLPRADSIFVCYAHYSGVGLFFSWNEICACNYDYVVMIADRALAAYLCGVEMTESVLVHDCYWNHNCCIAAFAGYESNCFILRTERAPSAKYQSQNYYFYPNTFVSLKLKLLRYTPHLLQGERMQPGSWHIYFCSYPTVHTVDLPIRIWPHLMAGLFGINPWTVNLSACWKTAGSPCPLLQEGRWTTPSRASNRPPLSETGADEPTRRLGLR